VSRHPASGGTRAISPGPLATRRASGIPEFDALLDKVKAKAPARSLVSIEDVGVATAFLAHDAARLITGGMLYIDGDYHIMDRGDSVGNPSGIE
jgi:enoyl-[acyl-carrier protein] reductase I